MAPTYIHTDNGETPPTAVDAIATPPRRAVLFTRLIAMMLLEFVVFGSWFATVGLVLSSNGLADAIAPIYSLAAVAAIVSPMFLGALADRYMPSQRVLGIAHLAGGAIMFTLPGLVNAANGALVLGVAFLYMVFFQPTLSLANAIAFRHLGGDTQLFPYIRVTGTLGWVIAGLLVGALGLSASSNIFIVTAIASVLLGVYAFTLPNTPPPAKGKKFSLIDVVGARAFVLFRHHDFRVFFICASLTSVSLGVYNTWASPYLGALGIENVAGVLAIGQACEVLLILTIPWVLKRIGMKWSLLVGMMMWGVRFALFIVAADTAPWWAILAVALQGICNDFFLILGAMYIDWVAPEQVRAQAQGMLILVISGVGALIGASLSGAVYGHFVAPVADAAGPTAWWPVFLICIISATITSTVWLLFFKQRRGELVTRLELSAAQTEAGE